MSIGEKIFENFKCFTYVNKFSGSWVMLMTNVEVKKDGYLSIGKTEAVEISVDTFLCKGCGICLELCPRKVFEWSKELSEKGVHYPIPVNADKCVKCKLCELLCPDFAIAVKW
ncbi:MAG: 2-ketoglutarate:ferredoxin oxidoreductase subunit delta [Thermococcus sp. 40_45]|uniref:2-ketoglutarate:ferredoxin oxidoreductase and 2-oxoglutarate ferredoxin oxidoreductase 2 (KGOR), subunit delta n=3 Tax=Thermococcaceae TaxID=2259 RepID=C6A4H8_THESM|nr:2-ketoglutarate:ferredoxin oxidoreductase and 2-oxoglutarate ferredoxin oxidoreductase 2 (KGOR), subunit delta [Thermococcus sibiricus MM 739]KUK28280.1 MAG: 2-ketoglutarate:ferredoxin oxidoreductase subunit delta [Thermococcus sp. 40_45]